MNKNTKFNKAIINDIRPFIVSNMEHLNLTHKQVDELVHLSYVAYLENKYNISKEDLKLEYNNGFFEYFNRFYKEFLFLTIAALVDSRINNMPKQSFNMILAYDNSLTTSSPNSATFSDNTDEVKQLRKRLEEKWYNT